MVGIKFAQKMSPEIAPSIVDRINTTYIIYMKAIPSYFLKAEPSLLGCLPFSNMNQV